MPTTDEKMKLASRLVRHRVEELGDPQPESPSLSVFYSPGNGFTAQIGSNYAGYFESRAEVPVYLGEYFSTMDELLDWLILRLSPEGK